MTLRTLFAYLVLAGCQQLRPTEIDLQSYPEVVGLFDSPVAWTEAAGLQKTVSLDGTAESQNLAMDSMTWIKELRFLKEIDPSQPTYVGAFERTDVGEGYELSLPATEKGSLKYFRYSPSEEGVRVEAIVHEDKDVYVHHREIELTFEEGGLKSYLINGYQKILLKDTIRFRIEGMVR